MSVFGKYFNEPVSKVTHSINKAETENSMDKNETSESKEVEGRIIKLSPDGWGFISSKDVPFTRIFFHWTSLVQDTLGFAQLHKGMRVSFTPIEIKEKGIRAIKIKVIE